LSTKYDQLEWRRSRVVEMRAKGMSQIEIARELQVSRTSITSDIQYLRNQAKETIKKYVTEHLPEQYQVCLTALDTILKHAFEILEASDDNREKLQAMELLKDTHLVKLELLSNATTVDSALQYIKNKQQAQNKKLALDSTTSKDNLNDDQISGTVGRQTVSEPSLEILFYKMNGNTYLRLISMSFYSILFEQSRIFAVKV
jgi:tRNA(Ile)-lysidine synthase TilS/MesJ